MGSPLEQFQVFDILSLKVLGLDSSITTTTLYLGVNSLLFWIIFKFLMEKGYNQVMLEKSYEMVGGMIYEYLGISGMKYVPWLMTIFFLILMSNFIGLIPYNFTITSQIVVTVTLALFVNLGIFMKGISLQGYKFFEMFIPSGVPKGFIPLIFVIELVSYLLRTISLSVRLFANMTAGHILLFIILSFIVYLLHNDMEFIAGVPFILLVGIYILEMGIALIQAYVFVVMSTLYLQEVV